MGGLSAKFIRVRYHPAPFKDAPPRRMILATLGLCAVFLAVGRMWGEVGTGGRPEWGEARGPWLQSGVAWCPMWASMPLFWP